MRADSPLTVINRQARAPRDARKAAIPADFPISEGVRKWAAGKGYGHLETHHEMFIGRHRANGKQYVDWEQAFKNCIREDWYSLRATLQKVAKAVAL
jgi:hypothetical protein